VFQPTVPTVRPTLQTTKKQLMSIVAGLKLKKKYIFIIYIMIIEVPTNNCFIYLFYLYNVGIEKNRL